MNRDPKEIGEKILELRKKHPDMSITEIADLVMSPLVRYNGNSHQFNGYRRETNTINPRPN